MGVRFFVDADLLGVAKLLVTVRSDVTYPGDPGGIAPDGLPRLPCEIQPSAKDVDWIPIVARNHWVVITHDRHLRSRPAEQAAIIDNAARVVTLDGRRRLTKWDQLEIIVNQWRKFEELADLPGPWMFTATRSGCRRFEF